MQIFLMPFFLMSTCLINLLALFSDEQSLTATFLPLCILDDSKAQWHTTHVAVAYSVCLHMKQQR